MESNSREHVEKRHMTLKQQLYEQAAADSLLKPPTQGAVWVWGRREAIIECGEQWES